MNGGWSGRSKNVRGLLLGLGLFCSASAQGQFELEVDPDLLLRSVQEWAEENIDPKVLDALGVDAERVGQFFQELQKRFQATSIYDLSSLREAAPSFLLLLREFEETRPYAVWLETHLDYLDVSEKLRGEAAPKGLRPPNPSPQRVRSVWVTEVKTRPVPARAERYLVGLKRIFTEEKMPPELVWIAEVESGFDPLARSPVGAAGLYQLMPRTARSLDLSLRPRDERLQPGKNARAAARYLRQLQDRFGDWRLALAAYNAGPTRVSDLLGEADARTFEGIYSRLPAETQMYVPKVEAVLLKREGMALNDLRRGRG